MERRRNSSQQFVELLSSDDDFDVLDRPVNGCSPYEESEFYFIVSESRQSLKAEDTVKDGSTSKSEMPAWKSKKEVFLHQREDDRIRKVDENRTESVVPVHRNVRVSNTGRKAKMKKQEEDEAKVRQNIKTSKNHGRQQHVEVRVNSTMQKIQQGSNTEIDNRTFGAACVQFCKAENTLLNKERPRRTLFKATDIFIRQRNQHKMESCDTVQNRNSKSCIWEKVNPIKQNSTSDQKRNPHMFSDKNLLPRGDLFSTAHYSAYWMPQTSVPHHLQAKSNRLSMNDQWHKVRKNTSSDFISDESFKSVRQTLRIKGVNAGLQRKSHGSAKHVKYCQLTLKKTIQLPLLKCPMVCQETSPILSLTDLIAKHKQL